MIVPLGHWLPFCVVSSVQTKSGRLSVPERCDLLVQKSAFKDGRIVKNISSISIHSKAGIDEGKRLQFRTLCMALVSVFVFVFVFVIRIVG